MRKLVTLRTIADIRPIENADRIEEVVVDGWSMVCQKGVHSVGDNVLYFEIDSFLPESDSRYESFMKFGIREFEGVKGHRVKTVRLRGVYSQGVLLPLSEFPEIIAPEFDKDYSELLGIVKWEKPEVTGSSGDQKGSFPWFLRKSDQERIQNIYNKLRGSEEEFVGTLKMDGSSITVYYVDKTLDGEERVGYCSRNMELKVTEGVQEISNLGKFEQGALNSDLFNKVVELYEKTGKMYAIQGELVGAGIQGNFEKFEKYQVFAYNIFDILKGDFVNYKKFKQLSEMVELRIVPEIYPNGRILLEPLETILQMAEGNGLRASYREGIVWKSLEGTTQFKAISNEYLSKEKD